MIYRSAGLMERAIAAQAAGADKSQQSMKVLEEYAIESSISKVYGSEMLDFWSTKRVQIFGGYGFHEDYPVARAYRDSRVNRIFEGTNEINRMLIIQMLMKRAMGGALPLMPAARSCAEEILAGPSLRGRPDRRLGPRKSAPSRRRRRLPACGRSGRAEIPREACRPAGNRRRAFRHRDGILRDGIRAAPRAKSAQPRAAKQRRGDGRRRPRVSCTTPAIASRRERAPRSPPRSKATCCARNSPCCAASPSASPWT